MASNLLYEISGVCLLILVSSVICGRVPVGISRLDLPEEKEDLKPYESSDEYLDLDSLHYNSEDPETYITDVQINELQNAEEKKISQDQEIYHVDPRCPTFTGLCNALTCTSHEDCNNKTEGCCFNGCVKTCLSRSPPIAVDWIPFGEEKLILLSERTKDTITIPGGCKVTLKQQKSLDLFLKYGHVTKCVCKKDDVVCFIRKRYPSVSPNDSDENLNQVYA